MMSWKLNCIDNRVGNGPCVLKFRYIPGKPEYFHEPRASQERNNAGLPPYNIIQIG